MTEAKELLPRTMTLEEYENTPEGVVFEIIDGVVYDLAGTSKAHRNAAGQIYAQILRYLEGKHCMVGNAPFDVFLNEDTVVQPDVFVSCHPEKDRDRGFYGAPDMIAEVISPGNSGHDTVTKMELYRLFGVREYWLVWPDLKRVQVNLLENGMYLQTGVYGEEDLLPVHVLKDCKVDLSKVFS